MTPVYNGGATGDGPPPPDVSRETWTSPVPRPRGRPARRRTRPSAPRPSARSGSCTPPRRTTFRGRPDSASSRSPIRRAASGRPRRRSTSQRRSPCRDSTRLVIDLDPQGNASTALGIEHREGTPSSYEVLIGEIPLSEALQRSPHNERLYCVPATIDLAGAEIELVSMVAREGRLRNALAGLQEHDFDYVFIDCPPSLGLLTINALVAAPEVLIPIQCEYYALEGVGQLLRNIEMVKSHLNPEPRRHHRDPHDVRRAHQARRSGRRQTSAPTSATRFCAPSSRAASRSPKRRDTA